MVAENGLGTELLSGSGVVSTRNEDLHPYLLWVLNMLDFIILGSMDIGREVTPRSFLLDLVEKLKVCEVNEPRGVILALEDLCCPLPMLQFTNTLSSPGTHTLSGICAAGANRRHGS